MTCNTKESNAFSVHLIKQESCYSIGNSPQSKLFRRVTGIGMAKPSFIESAETKVSRQGKRQIKDTTEYTAELEFVLTKDIVDYLPESFFGSFTSLFNQTFTDIDYNSTTRTISSLTGGFLQLTAGSFIFVSSETELAFNESMFVESIIDDNTLVIKQGSTNLYSDFTGVTATIKSSTLRSGNEKHYMAVQTRIEDSTQPQGYVSETITGCLVNGINLTIGASGEITGTLSLVGTGIKYGEIAGMTELPEDTSEPLMASNSLSKIISDYKFDYDAGVSDMSFEFSNNISTTNRAGYSANNVITPGSITCTGSYNTMMEGGNVNRELTKYRNSEDFAITMPLEMNGDDLMYITIANAKYTDLQRNNSGNEIVINSGSFSAQEDSFGATIQVDKNF